MGFSDTRTMAGDNDPNGLIQHSIKQRTTMASFPPPFSIFFPFQYLLSKAVLIWAKSPGSVKHQVVGWGSFSSNRWPKYFMTNGHGTIAGQPIFQLLLYVTAATHPGSSSCCSPAPGPPWKQPGMWEPPCCSLPAAQVTLGTGRKPSACHLRQETWGTLVLQKSHEVQPVTLMLNVLFLSNFYLPIVLSARAQRNCKQLLSALNRKGIYCLPHFAVHHKGRLLSSPEVKKNILSLQLCQSE